jgi:hypothetical protein
MFSNLLDIYFYYLGARILQVVEGQRTGCRNVFAVSHNPFLTVIDTLP